jgi:hypothetical protein
VAVVVASRLVVAVEDFGIHSRQKLLGRQVTAEAVVAFLAAASAVTWA